MKSNFKKKWIIANTIAMLVAYLIYTPIAHGFTGSHTKDLTSFQMVMHVIALGTVAFIVFYAQRSVLSKYTFISWKRITISIIIFIIMFWIGYYQPFYIGPDTDSIISYLVLGSALWIGNIPTKNHPIATIIAILSFSFGAFIGQLLLFAIVTALDATPNVQENIWHSIYWLSIGVTAGLIGGWLSGIALYKMLIRNETKIE